MQSSSQEGGVQVGGGMLMERIEEKAVSWGGSGETARLKKNLILKINEHI